MPPRRPAPRPRLSDVKIRVDRCGRSRVRYARQGPGGRRASRTRTFAPKEGFMITQLAPHRRSPAAAGASLDDALLRAVLGAEWFAAAAVDAPADVGNDPDRLLAPKAAKRKAKEEEEPEDEDEAEDEEEDD